MPRDDAVQLEGPLNQRPFGWFTQRPPEVDSADPNLQRMLAMRNLRTEVREWVGAAKGRGREGQSGETRQNSEQVPNSSRAAHC